MTALGYELPFSRSGRNDRFGTMSGNSPQRFSRCPSMGTRPGRALFAKTAYRRRLGLSPASSAATRPRARQSKFSYPRAIAVMNWSRMALPTGSGTSTASAACNARRVSLSPSGSRNPDGLKGTGFGRKFVFGQSWAQGP